MSLYQKRGIAFSDRNHQPEQPADLSDAEYFADDDERTPAQREADEELEEDMRTERRIDNMLDRGML